MLGIGFALYVYRFPIGIGNISILRVTMLGLGLYLLFGVTQLKIGFPENYGALTILIILLCGLNIYYYPSLDDYPIPKTEIIAHIANMFLLLEIVLFVDTERRLILILNGYIMMSMIAILIGYYGFLFDHIPFEEILRIYGSDSAVNLSYINQDDDVLRFTGSFMDPNFFGIYLLSVIIFSVWLYKFRCRHALYLIVASCASITLLLTLSRTSMIGGIVFLGLFIYWMNEKNRLWTFAISFILCALGASLLKITNPDIFYRLLNPESVYDRMHFISKGWEAFLSHPFFGSGPVSIVDDETGIATAHLMYLSILAKFGIFGTLIYLLFIFYPAVFILCRRKSFKIEYLFLILGLYLPLFFMYFLYDFLTFLEFEYFIFSVGYSVVFSSYASNSTSKTKYDDASSSSVPFCGSSKEQRTLLIVE